MSLCLGQSLWADAFGSASGGDLTQPTGDASDPIVGTANVSNCIPFACEASFGINTYQQVYSESAFSGLTPFDQINFFNAFFSGPGLLDSGTYDIYFSYTSKAVDGLSAASPSDNISADETLFGAYTLPGGSAPSTLTFNGTTFAYDPTLGNLLMTITTSGVVDGDAYYKADSTGSVTSRAYFGAATGADAVGLVTSFNDVPSSVPEPAAIALLATVLAFAGPSLLKRRRRV